MKRNFYILVIMFAGVVFFSCHKERDGLIGETTYQYLDKSILPYKFRAGSYWIYLNDTTGVLDSITVISTDSGFYWGPPPVHGYAGVRNEYYKINLKSSLSTKIYNDYLTRDYIKRNGGGEYGQEGQPIFTANYDSITGLSGMKKIAWFPSMLVNGITFSNVIETKITVSAQSQPVFTNDTYFYFSPDIGLIKKVTDLGNGKLDKWSIKRWFVKR